MSGFLGEHFELILIVLVVGYFVFQMIRLLNKAKKVDNNGIITDAVISNIDEIWDPDQQSSTYTTYARFTDDKGDEIESPMTVGSEVKFSVGEHVRIRYMPGDYELVRLVEDDNEK